MDSSPSQVLLNIGGKKYSTTIDTLTQREPDSMLAAMFSARHTVSRDMDTGMIFVDRDGKHFRHILNWLRDGFVPTLGDSEYQQLLREAEYYQLLGLVEHISLSLNKKKDEDDSEAELTRKDVIKCIQSERVRFRGVNLCGLDLSKLGLVEHISSSLNKKKDEDDSEAELTRKDVIKCIQSERVRFRGVNLCGLDLSKLDLSLVDFSYACVRRTTFSSSFLHKAKLGDVEAEDSNFQDAILRECEFVGANLRGAVLDRANLQSANLQDACLIGCSFLEADLRSAHLQNAKLMDANLKGANLEGANLKGAKLSGANLQQANLQRAYLREVDLRDTQLEGARLGGANLLGAIR